MRGRNIAHRGRQNHTALMRTAFVRADQTNSARRLQRDYKELMEAKEPLVGVSAKPLPNDMYTWHGNIRGPPDTKWESGVFHFEMNIPQDYPCSPPTIKFFAQIPHPNVFGNTLCLDMLDNKNHQIYQGWSSAYTIETILIQLQSFLFEPMPEDIETSKNIKIAQAIKQANDFVCTTCRHKGPLSADPPFAKNEKNLEDFLNLKPEKQLLKEELVCFQTKIPVREHTLGIGISIKRSQRTGGVSYVNPTMDLMNMRAFTKMKIRKSLGGERFTHWLPLYFGEAEQYEIETHNDGQSVNASETESYQVLQTVDTRERFEKLLQNSMSFIANGKVSKGYTTESVLEIMPKLIHTHVCDMMKENRHVSIIAIRRLMNFIRLFQWFIEKDEKIQKVIDETIEHFKKDPERRNKYAKTPFTNLGDIQVLATMSKKYKFSDIVTEYSDEQMDRQVFWMLRTIPELDFEDKKFKKAGKVDEKERIKVCFNHEKTSYYLYLFFHHLNKTFEKVVGDKKNLGELSNLMDANHGCLDREIENQFQQDLFSILEVNSYQEYYKEIGLNISEDKDIYEKLTQAVKNSRQKGYHGQDEQKKTPLEEYSIKKVTDLVGQFADIKSEKQEVKPIDDAQSVDSTTAEKKFKIHFKKISPKDSLKTDSDWKKLCHENFDFIKQELESNKDTSISAAKLAAMHDYYEFNRRFITSKKLYLKQDKLGQQLQELRGQKPNVDLEELTQYQEYDPKTFTYKKLMIKLAFEQILQELENNQNFEMIYEFIKTYGEHLETINFSMVDKTSLKSNNYWLMAIIPKLKNLKNIKLLGSQYLHRFGQDGYKFLAKAFSYFQKNGGKITKYSQSILNSDSGEYLYQVLKCLPDLQVICFKDANLTVHDCKALGKVLSDFKCISELDLTHTSINKEMGKEIADGLIRAKQLEVLKMGENPILDCSQIFYNLAFSPKIKHIDITGNTSSKNAQTAESIYKLLKISGSIQNLLLGRTNIMMTLTEDFMKAMGESKTLEYLNLDFTKEYDGTKKGLTASAIVQFGNAIGFNHYKNGSLTSVSMEGALIAGQFEQLIAAMYISDMNHEEKYGDPKVANEMKQEQLVKKFHCGLKYLNLNSCNLNCTEFKLKEIQKQKDPEWPKQIEFFAKSGIKACGMSKSGLTYKGIDTLVWSIGQNPVQPCKNLKILDLSLNNITQVGAEALAQALEKNKSIEFLDLSQNHLGVYGAHLISKSLQKNTTLKALNLFKNTIDVDGARAVRDLLLVNSNIEFLDIGHNRIRQKGLEAIIQGITNAKQTSLKSLGLRMNFINDDGFTTFFNEVIFSGISKLENLYILENNLTQYKALKLKEKLKQKMYIDQFEKLFYLQEEKLKKSVWFGPVNSSEYNYIIQQFKVKVVGLVKSLRLKDAKKLQVKTTARNKYLFVEFEIAEDSERVAQLMRKKKINVSAKSYVAGSNTFVAIRRSKRK